MRKLWRLTSVESGNGTRCTVIPRPGPLRPPGSLQRIGQDAPTSPIVLAFLKGGWAAGESAGHLNPSKTRSKPPKRLANRAGRTDVPDGAGLHSCKKRQPFPTSSEWALVSGARHHLRSRWNHGQYVLTMPKSEEGSRWHPVIRIQVKGISVAHTS